MTWIQRTHLAERCFCVFVCTGLYGRAQHFYWMTNAVLIWRYLLAYYFPHGLTWICINDSAPFLLDLRPRWRCTQQRAWSTGARRLKLGILIFLQLKQSAHTEHTERNIQRSVAGLLMAHHHSAKSPRVSWLALNPLCSLSLATWSKICRARKGSKLRVRRSMSVLRGKSKNLAGSVLRIELFHTALLAAECKDRFNGAVGSEWN